METLHLAVLLWSIWLIRNYFNIVGILAVFSELLAIAIIYPDALDWIRHSSNQLI